MKDLFALLFFRRIKTGEYVFDAIFGSRCWIVPTQQWRVVIGIVQAIGFFCLLVSYPVCDIFGLWPYGLIIPAGLMILFLGNIQFAAIARKQRWTEYNRIPPK